MQSKRMLSSCLAVIASLLIFSSCAVVNPGEVGLKQRFGELQGKVYQPGIVNLNPLTTKVVKVPTRTVNLEVGLNLPSKEGLNVRSEISILYHILPEKAPEIIQTVGRNYEDVLILSVFRSSAADICAQFFAKDMHSGNRGIIETQIKNRMDSLLAGRGFVIESVLMKSINLPAGLYNAIEDKLKAEQEAQRMQFVLETERREAERKKIEAAGTRDAQKILVEGLNNYVIRWRSLEVLQKLASSPNAKLIITDGKTPVLISDDEKKD